MNNIKQKEGYLGKVKLYLQDGSGIKLELATFNHSTINLRKNFAEILTGNYNELMIPRVLDICYNGISILRNTSPLTGAHVEYSESDNTYYAEFNSLVTYNQYLNTEDFKYVTYTQSSQYTPTSGQTITVSNIKIDTDTPIKGVEKIQKLVGRNVTTIPSSQYSVNTDTKYITFNPSVTITDKTTIMVTYMRKSKSLYTAHLCSSELNELQSRFKYLTEVTLDGIFDISSLLSSGKNIIIVWKMELVDYSNDKSIQSTLE